MDDVDSVEDGSWEGSGDGVPRVFVGLVVVGGVVLERGVDEGSCHGTDVDIVKDTFDCIGGSIAVGIKG